MTSTNAVALFVMTIVLGALSFGVGSALVSRVLAAATEAPTLGGSFATVALNVGAAVGPMLAGAVSAVWLSVALSALALVLLPFLGREPHDLRVVQSGR
jgi:DHA1 family chloramphenicol resistance protein-like MFS transporter